MTEELFDKMNYEISSWALWPEDNSNIDLRTFFINHINELKPNIVFLGLNQSNSKHNQSNEIKPFSNFHSPNHKGDKVLKTLINSNSNLAGGFMTDISPIKDSDSNNVLVNSNDVKSFISKLSLLNEKKYTVICFGDKVYESIKKEMNIEEEIHLIKNHILKFSNEIEKNIIIDIYRVWHYSNYGKYESKITELKSQLNYINCLL